MPTLKEKFLNPNINAENEPQVSFSPRAVSNFARNAFKGLKPENPTNLEEPENSVSSWDMIDSFQAGLGHMGKHIGKTIEDVTRPDDVSIPDWHEQDSFAKRLQDYSEELIRNNSHQYEQNSVPYFLDMAMQSAPETITDLLISMGIGSAVGGPAGAVVGGGANLILKAKKARDLAWAISKAYQGSSKAAKVARAVIPGSAQEAIALGSGAVMEAQSEALDAEERYIEKAKADGTYVRGQTEEEARAIYNQVLKDQTAIISAFNVPQYGAIYGKAAKGLLGKAGTLAKAIVPEAAEEMSQYADTQYRLDDPLTAQGFIDSGVTGALMGGGMHVAGRGSRYIADRLAGNPTEEQREAAELARKAFSKQNSRQTQNIYDDFRGEVSEALNSSEIAKRDAYGQAYNEALRDWTRNNDKRQIAGDNVHDTIVRIANKYGVPPEKALAVAMIESNGNQDVVSPVGAIGVMQLMPETAEELGVDPNDMEQNIDGGVRYLKKQYDRFGDWNLAFAAYNAGAGTVERYGGIPDYPETQNYVALAKDILSTAPDSQGNGQTRNGNIFGVENYDMPREQMESSVEGLKAGWSEVIPQIGGVLKSMGYDPVLTSAARTREHQMRINPDAPNSYHIIQDDGGDAIDISLSEGELTPEQEQAVLDYFKGTGLFNEVLYHSVVGGKHLHLGGLNTEKLRNGQSIQSRADQIFSENYNPNEHKPPQWNDYYNDRRKQRQGDTSQNKSEPPKPLFDLNAEDEQTQKLLEQFATERRNSSTGAQAAQDSVFFEPMFKDGKFQNTPENRAAVMERYGDEFTAWAKPLLQQSQPSQTEQSQIQKQDPVQNNKPPESVSLQQKNIGKIYEDFLMSKYSSLKENPEEFAWADSMFTRDGDFIDTEENRAAIRNRYGNEFDNWLKENNIELPKTEQHQEDPVQNNKPPENVLSQPEQQTQENQTPPQVNANTYVQAALVQPVGGTSKAAKDARIEQGKKLQVLADQHGVKIPEPIRVSLNHGAIKAITETQKRLLDSGKLFNSEPQQVQTPQAQTKFADDLSVAKQEIPEDKNARKSQGESILRVVNFSQNVNSLYPNGNSPIPRIDLPAGLEQALQRGDEKAIRKAQEIIENAGLKIETSPQGTTAPTTGNTRGNTAEVITGSRTPHQIRYKVVEASDLNTSHLIDNGGVFANENYPAELQPRDRERSDMQARLISMGNNLTPADLLDARDVNQGAPVTRNDGVVLNGNGRTAAIRYAYEKGKGDPYKNALIQNAEKFGLNADEISKMNQPILVRELTHSLTDEEMRDLTGTQTGGARMGASEQAQADAAKLSQATLNQFPQGDNVDLSQAESTDFLRAALNDIATPDEINSLTTADGKISQEGINRVRRALFANAYGDKGVVSRMSESTDDNVRGITNALLNAAPTIAKVQAAMKNGTAHNHDLSVIAKAVEKLSNLRDEGKPVSKYLQEQGLFAEHADSEEVKEILSFFDKNKHAPNKIAAFLKNIANRIQNQGDPREENLFGSNEPAPLIDLIKGARRELENNGQQNIFTQEESKSETQAETRQSEQKETSSKTKQEEEKEDTTPPESPKPKPEPEKTITDAQINEAAKNPDIANALEQLGAKIEEDKVTFPDKETREACINLIKALNDPNFKFSIAWHGTRHQFDEFSLDAIGTGEGAQVHGWGLYFAGNRKVSEGYRRRLSGSRSSIPTKAKVTINGKTFYWERSDDWRGKWHSEDGTAFNPRDIRFNPKYTETEQEEANLLYTLVSEDFDQSKVLKIYEKRVVKYQEKVKKERAEGKIWSSRGEAFSEGNLKQYLDIVNLIHTTQIKLTTTPVGTLFKVEIPDENVMLDEQKTLAEQTKGVRYVCNRIARERGITLRDDMTGRDIYHAISKTFDRDIHKGSIPTSKLFNKYGVKGITYVGGRDGRCYVVFDDKAIKILEKLSLQGNGDTTISNFVAKKDLTPFQKLFVTFGEKLGVKVVFFDNPNGNFHGAHAGNVTFLNVNSKMPLGKVFWHESLHWLRNNNPELYKSLVKAAGITNAQRKAYLEETERTDLTTDAEINEEIIADQFQDVAKRTGLLQSIAGKNRGLIQRVVQWLKDTMNKFIDHFRNPSGKLTTKQAQALADEFGRIATQLKDPNGDKIFRYNRRTHNIELADGRDLTESAIEEMTRKGAHHPVKLSENENAATEGERHEIVAGYYTESGHSLNKSKSTEFIVDENGNRDIAQFSKEVTEKSNGAVKALPIRLKVGAHSFQTLRGRGYKHITAKHLRSIKNHGFNNAMDFINYTLNNFDKVYKHPTESNRIILFCNDDSRGFMPLELAQEDDNYTIITAFPNDNKNISGELVFDGSTTPPAATANGTTESKTTDVAAPADNKGGVKPSGANVETNSPSENIAQDRGNGKPKYSIGASEKPSFFDKAAKKLKKALGIDHDRVRTVEDQRQAHSEAQKKAMDTYLRDPSKENKEKLRALRVTNEQLEAYQNGEEYMNSLGLIQNVGGSPSRVADKNIIFRAFFNLGDKAMDRLIRERDTFMRHYDKAMSLVKSKEDFEQFASLLWLGDTTQQEFTKEELLREGVPENVAEAYTQIRRQIERGYQMADKVQRRAREHAEYLTDEQIDDLHDNKFAYDIKDLNKVDDDGKKLVRWQEYENHVQTVRVTEKALEKLRADDSIQILSEKQLKQGNDKGKYDVKFREGKPTLQHLKGYIPHFFHKYAVVIKDSNGKQIGGILGTGNTEREAIKLADEWLKNHNLESDREIYISPFEFNAEGALGMNSNYAPTVGDKDFNAMLKNIAKNSEMSLAKAKKLLDGSVKLKNRHRFLGQLMQRNGYKGYEKDMAWVLQHHFNSLSRYVALESEFKPQAISLFERVFGAFDKDHSKNLLAQYTKNYINDVNGVPAWIDEVTNKALNQNPVWRKYFLPVLGERGVQTVAENITSRIAYLKLGMLNISSAVINYTQLTNAAGYLGSPTQLMKHFGQIAARGGKLTIGEMKILMGSGVAQDIGLDTSSGYDKNRGQNAIPGLDWLGNKSMKLFQNCDSLCRAATALAAYDKAIAEGKTKQQALNYAKEINRKANFSYGVEDAPNAMRRTGAYGKVMLQFYKYPFKQLEVISDFMPTSTRTTFKQKAVFWIPYIFQAGLVGLIPGFDWGDELLNEKFRLFPKDFLQKLCIKGTQEVFGKDSEVGKKVAQVMMYGAPALLGADVSKRVGLASLMPQDLPSFLLGAAGTTIVDGTRGAYNWAMHDEPGVNAVRAISPGLANIYTAAIEGETKDYRGRTVSIYETAWDRILRGMGFRSTDESVAADVQRINFNSRSDRLKDEQRAIDAYIADRSPENLKRLKELHIKPERVKEESRKKKLDRRGRIEQNMTKRERMDNRYLLEFAR